MVRQSQGFETCVGFEVSHDPTTPGDLDELDLRLTDLVRTYPMLDYVWVWQPEAWGVHGTDTYPSRTDFGAYYRRFEKYFDYIKEPYRRSEGVRMAVYALAAHRTLQREAPRMRMVLSGWGGDKHCHFTDFYPGLDKILPKDIVFSALDNISTTDTVSEHYAELPKDREFWPIPWFECDGDQWFPQPHTKNLYNIARDSLKKGAKGLLAIHWRTRDVEESHAYMSQFAWNPTLSYEDFYKEYARKSLGDERYARMLMDLDGLGYRWIGGGGQAECGEFTWGPGAEDGAEKLDRVLGEGQGLPRSERLDYINDTAAWARDYDEAAKILCNAGATRTLLNALKAEGRKPTPAEFTMIQNNLNRAYKAFGSAMADYSLRVSNRGELGVLATINTKAWADLKYVTQAAEQVAGVRVDTNVSHSKQPLAVSSILRAATGFSGRAFRISALVHSASPAATAAVYYRSPGKEFRSSKLVFVNAGRLEGQIPGSDVGGQLLDYYIRVEDNGFPATWPQRAPENCAQVSIVPAPAKQVRKDAANSKREKRAPGNMAVTIGPALVQLEWNDDSSVKAFRSNAGAQRQFKVDRGRGLSRLLV